MKFHPENWTYRAPKPDGVMLDEEQDAQLLLNSWKFDNQTKLTDQMKIKAPPRS